MFAKPVVSRDAVKYFIVSWIFSSATYFVYGQEGNGCGHTLLGTESGTLTSQNYPGTYPANTRCVWKLRVPQGRTLRLQFGDFDIESSPGCSNGSLMFITNIRAPSLGPWCGTLTTSQKNLTVNSNEVMVVFKSGPHHSGRGFLLSYTTDQYPDLISCLKRGSHFVSPQLSVYCPAGCTNVTGDIWGHSEQGYRDTSVLCKSAVHAGVVSDTIGGQITMTYGRSLTLYESTFANGIVSKMGPLSEKKIIFYKECNSELAVINFNASFLEQAANTGKRMYFSRNKDSGGESMPWAADSNYQGPLLEIELAGKSTVTGIITEGSLDFYIESYIILFSKDKKNWKMYKSALTKEKKVFQAHSDGHLRVFNSLFPTVVARFLRLQPQSWLGRASAQVQIMGCPVAKNLPNPRSSGGSPSVKVNMVATTVSPVATEGPVIVKGSSLSSSQPIVVAVGVLLGIILCVGCLMAGVWWKKRKKGEEIMNHSLPKGCQSFQGKSLPCTEPELISYPLERSAHDALPPPPLNDYDEPDVASGGQKLGFTFRPPLDEGYTTPFRLNYYDTPGQVPEYAEPLLSEPEYATPFSDQPPEPNLANTQGHIHNQAHGHSFSAPLGGKGTTYTQAKYDCPSHKELPNGYCTPSLNDKGPRPASVVYAEPQSSDSLLQLTYEEPS